MTSVLRDWRLYGVLVAVVVLAYGEAFRQEARRGEAPALRAAERTEPVPTDWWEHARDAEALRQLAVERPQVRVWLGILSLVITGLFFGGFVLTFWGLWTGAFHRLWTAPLSPPAPWTWREVLGVTALTGLIASLLPFVRIAVLAFAPSVPTDLHWWLTASMVVVDAVVILAVLAFAAGKGRTPRRVFGFSSARVRRSVPAALRGYVTLFPWLFLLLLGIIEAARFFKVAPPMEPIQELLFQEQRPLVLGLTVLLACLVGPVAEEFFFRGVLYAALRRRAARWAAMLISGALFSLVHTNLLGFLPILLLGCLLADAYERTGSLAGPMAIHIAHNTFLMSLAFIFRQLPSGG
jgi:membrane protease YdiL (CAAX protease family)